MAADPARLLDSDLGRAKAQHMYLNSMIRELQSQNVFTDAPAG